MSSLTPDTSRARGLERLLDPTDMSSFIDHYLGERMLYVKGSPGRWADLFSWQDLERILNTGLIPYPMARLMKQGPEVAPALYTFERGSRQWLDPRKCQELMASGATLIMMHVDGLTPQLTDFVHELERDLCSPVRVDVVATTANVPGLNLHWDDSECFNIHLDGEKDWQVVQPERLHPLTATRGFPDRRDVTTSTAPTTAPVWSGTVSNGDLMYLPRGWWHAVTPRVSPSLHLSIAADVPTLTDYLRWLALDAARLETARRAIPVWLSTEERRARVASWLTELQAELTPESLDRYLTQLSDAAPRRTHFSLPKAATPGGTTLDASTRLRMQTRRPLDITSSNGTVSFTWRGQQLTFPAQALGILQALDARRTMTLAELGEHRDRMLAQVIVFALVNAGLLSVVSSK